MNFYLLHAIKNMPQPLTKPAVTLAATAFCICTFTASGPMAHLWVLRPLRQAHGGSQLGRRFLATLSPLAAPLLCPGLPPRFMFWEALNCSMKLPYLFVYC